MAIQFTRFNQPLNPRDNITRVSDGKNFKFIAAVEGTPNMIRVQRAGHDDRPAWGRTAEPEYSDQLFSNFVGVGIAFISESGGYEPFNEPEKFDLSWTSMLPLLLSGLNDPAAKPLAVEALKQMAIEADGLKEPQHGIRNIHSLSASERESGDLDNPTS